MILHVTDARYLEGHKVWLAFNDGREGVADLRSALDGYVFEPLRDERYFSQLRLDTELDTVAWPNGADFAPEFLYFLAFKDDPDLQEQFQKWGYKAAQPV